MHETRVTHAAYWWSLGCGIAWGLHAWYVTGLGIGASVGIGVFLCCLIASELSGKGAP
jgi:hypothetical protein